MAFLPIPPDLHGPGRDFSAGPVAFQGTGSGFPRRQFRGARTHMGGMLKAPKPTVVTAAEPVATSAASAASVAEVAQTARLENQDRARRGLAGTIATSERGVLEAAPRLAASRKTLLGE